MLKMFSVLLLQHNPHRAASLEGTNLLRFFFFCGFRLKLQVSLERGSFVGKIIYRGIQNDNLIVRARLLKVMISYVYCLYFASNEHMSTFLI